MDQSTRRPLHPLLVIAAVAVILFCAVGIAAITGVLPTSRGTAQPPLDHFTEPTNRAELPLTESTRPPQQRANPGNAPRGSRAAAERTAADPAAVGGAPKPYERATQSVAESSPSAPAPICNTCGVIESVREVKQQGQGTGIGVVAGGVAGAVLGNQVGGGRGRDLATVAGAVGGAVAGHQVEKHVRTNSTYQITVRMDDGNIRTFTEASQPNWRTGERVRIDGNRLTREG